GEAQHARRRDRPRPPLRDDRRPHHGDPAQRDGDRRPPGRNRDDVCRRRAGQGDVGGEAELEMDLATLTYETGDRVARVTLNRPGRGNGIALRMPAELAECVERANLAPAVHAIALAGNGTGFCGGYDLVASAEGDMSGLGGAGAPPGSPVDPGTIAANHAPE